MLVKAINRQTHPYFALPTGTGWRVLDCKAQGRTFVSEEYDDKEDAIAHTKVLNEAYWLEWEAELATRAVIWKALEQSAPPPSSRGVTLLWILLKAFLRAIILVKKYSVSTEFTIAIHPASPIKIPRNALRGNELRLMT